jgi:glycerol 2-dehydrogenase (NADP+)
VSRLAATITRRASAKTKIDPYLPQQDIADFCQEKGILIEAYSPLGSTGSPLFQEEGVQEVAKKHNVGPGTVLLSYQVSKGHVVLAKSVTPSRIEENMKILKLDSSDIAALDKIHKVKGTTRFVYPPFGVSQHHEMVSRSTYNY